MKKFFHSISTMMLLVALTGMGLASCSESPEAPEDPTENPDDEDKGDGSEGEGGDENKTVELNYTVAEAAYWGDDYMEDGTSNLIVTSTTRPATRTASIRGRRIISIST